MIRPAAISFRYCFPEVDGGGVAVVADGGVVDVIFVGCGGGGCGGGGFGGSGGGGGGGSGGGGGCGDGGDNGDHGGMIMVMMTTRRPYNMCEKGERRR